MSVFNSLTQGYSWDRTAAGYSVTGDGVPAVQRLYYGIVLVPGVHVMFCSQDCIVVLGYVLQNSRVLCTSVFGFHYKLLRFSFEIVMVGILYFSKGLEMA